MKLLSAILMLALFAFPASSVARSGGTSFQRRWSPPRFRTWVRDVALQVGVVLCESIPVGAI